MGHRSHIDNSIELIGNLLFGSAGGPMVLKAVRPAGEPLVDDWSCLKSTVRLYLTLVGHLSASLILCFCCVLLLPIDHMLIVWNWDKRN